MDPFPGYDIRRDEAWAMRARVKRDREMICYLSTHDLTRSYDDLVSHLRESYPAHG